jgi:DNA-binding MarR family transcriptional regulator
MDMYHEAQQPVHYTTLADRLGVSKITAYDMLRLLEDRGLTSSEYVLRGKGQGAGRSSVFFKPTRQAEEMFLDLAGEKWDQVTWERVARQLLNTLRSTDNTQYLELLEKILVQLSDNHSPMIYAAKMIAAVILSLCQLQERITIERILDRLRSIGLPGRTGLNAIAGLTVGLSFVEDFNRHLAYLLLSHVTEYQQIISKLNVENLERLSAFSEEVLRIVEEQPNYRAMPYPAGVRRTQSSV